MAPAVASAPALAITAVASTPGALRTDSSRSTEPPLAEAFPSCCSCGVGGGAAEARTGSLSAALREELPGLRLRYLTVSLRRGRERPSARDRLSMLSERIRGAGVVALRTTPIAHAYRSFFRQVGLDPDVTLIPSERAAVARLRDGGLRSAGPVADACLVALLETGVPVWALDAGAVDEAGLGIGLVGEAATGAPEVPRGTLVVADRLRVHAQLFEDPPRGGGVGARTERVVLYAVAVAGVSELRVDEALWCAVQLL